MNYRKCPACNEQTEHNNAICTKCHKAVLVFDFSSKTDGKFNIDRFKIVYGQVCGWVDIPPFPDGSLPKPPREWRCWIKEPELFTPK